MFRENIGLSGEKSGSINGEIDLISYCSDRMALKTRQDSDGMLIISNNYSPFWHANVNGRLCKDFPGPPHFSRNLFEGRRK